MNKKNSKIAEILKIGQFFRIRKFILDALAILLFSCLLFFFGCQESKNGNSVLYLYVSEHNKQTFREMFTAAAAAARKYGARLVYKGIDELRNFEELIASEIREIEENEKVEARATVPQAEQTDIALGLVIYPSDWSPALNAQIVTLQRQSAKSKEEETLKQNRNSQFRINLWLLSRDMNVDELLAPKMQSRLGLDALSSPSATRPAKAAAKRFFSGLLEP